MRIDFKKFDRKKIKFLQKIYKREYSHEFYLFALSVAFLILSLKFPTVSRISHFSGLEEFSFYLFKNFFSFFEIQSFYFKPIIVFVFLISLVFLFKFLPKYDRTTVGIIFIPLIGYALVNIDKKQHIIENWHILTISFVIFGGSLIFRSIKNKEIDFSAISFGLSFLFLAIFFSIDS